jgi:hypothetical protein
MALVVPLAGLVEQAADSVVPAASAVATSNK